VFTRAPDGGDGLEADQDQVTTSEHSHPWKRGPQGMDTGGEPDVKRPAGPGGMDGWIAVRQACRYRGSSEVQNR
ncbi:unnamed protein product, partial [Staurois parvus]